MAAEEVDGRLIPKLKVSDSFEKTTDPGIKNVHRFYDSFTGKALADLIALEDENIDSSKPLVIFDPLETWKKTTLRNYSAKQLLLPVFIEGKQLYECPGIHEVCRYAQTEMDTFWDEYKRFLNPQLYKVDLSENLYNLKQELLKQIARQNK